MTSRFRKRDSRSNGSLVTYDNYLKPTCSASPVWSTYYTSGYSWPVGKYENMDDIVGDKPKPNTGVAGYRFHPMSYHSQEIGSGSGSSWEVKVITQDCSLPAELYNRRYRRSGALTPARQYCGFAFSIDPNGRLIMPNIVDPKQYSQAVNLCVTDCLSKVGRGGSSTNLYEALAEVDKTLGMASQYLQAATKIARSKGLINRCKAVGNAYLLTRYGFKPLVSDIFATLEALKTPLGSIIETTRSSSAVTSVTSYTNSYNDAGTFSIAGLVTRTQTVTVRATSLNQYQQTLQDALGLGYKNLMTVPWELVPYSFVVDWFVNVGDFIGSLTPNFGVSPIGSCLVTDVKTEDKWIQTGYTLLSPSTFSLISPPSSGYVSSTYHSKNRILGLPAPSLEIKTDFRFDHLTRCLDASALLLQRLR